MGDRVLAAQERGLEIDAQNPIPLFLLVIDERLVEGNPGIVDQNVDTAETVGDGQQKVDVDSVGLGEGVGGVIVVGLMLLYSLLLWMRQIRAVSIL